MLQPPLSLSFLLLSLMFFMFFVLSVCTANVNNVYVQCSQLNFTSTTPYESNVDSLFTSLVDSASLDNFNKFQTSPENDVVYGLFQCRGDLSSSNCKDCVTNAISQLKTTCPMSTGGQIQLEGCFVKYDGTSFFGAQEKTEVCKRCGPSIGYNSDVLNRVDGALAYLVGGNGQYFRAGDYGSIQGVAQCVQDLSLSDCEDCLSEACGRLRTECETSNWGDMYLGKCYIRYADQGNENMANNGNSTSKTSSGGGCKNNIIVKSWKWVLYITITLSVTVSVIVGFKKYVNYKATKKELEGVRKEKETAESANKELKKKAETAESAKTKAEKGKETAEKGKEIAEEELKKVRSIMPYYPPMPMPPPCAYVIHSNPNTCNYL